MKSCELYKVENRFFSGTSVLLSMLATVSFLVGCELNRDVAMSDGVDPFAAEAIGASSDMDSAVASGNEGFTSDLPSNPSLSSSAAEMWSFGYKDYDHTFRIRWPTHFANIGVGPGSYCTVNGERAAFRSFDTDNGAKRPSYTMPGPSSRLSGTVTCILYSSSGSPLGWFRTTAGGTTRGTLP